MGISRAVTGNNVHVLLPISGVVCVEEDVRSNRNVSFGVCLISPEQWEADFRDRSVPGATSIGFRITFKLQLLSQLPSCFELQSTLYYKVVS